MDALPARSRMQVVWLAGAAGLVLLLVAAGAVLGWRGLRTPAVEPGTAIAADVDPAPAGAGATPELVDGVVWDFDLTVEGAGAAAAAAVSVTGAAAVVFDADRFVEVAEVVFTPEEAAEQIRQVDAARVQFELSGWGEQPPARRTYHLAPLSVTVTGFDAAQATAQVEVWAMTVVGVGDRGGAVFTTSTVSLLADDGVWRVDALESAAGPTPIVEERADAPGRIRQLTRDALPMLLMPYGAQP